MFSIKLDNEKRLDIIKHDSNKFIVDLFNENEEKEFRKFIIADEFFNWVNSLPNKD